MVGVVEWRANQDRKARKFSMQITNSDEMLSNVYALLERYVDHLLE